VKFLLFFCFYSGNSPSCASFQLFPHVLVATSSCSNLFIPLCPDDSPSLVHFLSHFIPLCPDDSPSLVHFLSHFIPLCPDDSPSLVHFLSHGQATHLLPSEFHFFIFPFHLTSSPTAPLFIFFIFPLSFCCNPFFNYFHIPVGITHSSNLTGCFTFTKNQSPHMPSLV
jgi:hypothetical protein